MRVFITGATGLVGRALTLRLRQEEVRRAPAGPLNASFAPGGEAQAASGGPDAMRAINGCDAVVTLAGRAILPGRWTEKKKEAMRRSRVDLNQAVVSCVLGARTAPRSSWRAALWASMDTPVTTSCRRTAAREKATSPSSIKRGKVCSNPLYGESVSSGGERGSSLPPTEERRVALHHLRRQHTHRQRETRRPWIHIDDMVDAITFAITTQKRTDPSTFGHQSTSQRAFASALGRAVDPPSRLRRLRDEIVAWRGRECAPGGPVRSTGSAQELGFKHRFRDLDDAFRDILSTDRVHPKPEPNTGCQRGRFIPSKRSSDP